MDEKCMSRNGMDMLYLSVCALHGARPEADRIAGIDLEALYSLTKFHSMTAIVCMGLELGDAFENVEPDIVKKWQDAKHKAIRKNMLLDAERQQIFAYMEEQGIWYMPLKGSILKDLYPKYGMRQMSDNDILFDADYQGQMRDYMVSRGYKVEGYGTGSHDAYEKLPVYNFELHRSLFSAPHNPDWIAYYSNVKERLIKDDGSDYGYHFTDEDFYIYVMVHACKHYGGSGTGIRSLMDCYVYASKKGADLDWRYIDAECEKLGIADFERHCRALSKKIFSEPAYPDSIQLTEDEQTMLAYSLGSGTYGTTKNLVEKRIRLIQSDGRPINWKTKLVYYWRRLFPDMEWFKAYRPFCYRHKWVIPFFLVYRVFYGVLFKRAKVKNEVQIVQKMEHK